MINDNNEFAQSIMFMFFKLGLNRRKKFLDTLDNFAYWSFVNDSNKHINKCFGDIHTLLSNHDSWRGGYHPDYYNDVDNQKLLDLREEFISSFGGYKTAWQLDQMYFDLCECTLD